MTRKNASKRAEKRASAAPAKDVSLKAAPFVPDAPVMPQVLTPITTPPGLGTARLEIAASPFRVLRVTLRHFEYQELPREPGSAPPVRAAEAISTGMELTASVTLFVEAAEVALDVRVIPEPSRLPIRLRAAFSALLARPDGMPDEQFVPVIGEIGPRLLLPYVRQVITQVTALGLYGPLNLDLMNVRIVWEKPAQPST